MSSMVQVRLNDDDYDKLIMFSEQLGISKPSVLRILLRQSEGIKPNIVTTKLQREMENEIYQITEAFYKKEELSSDERNRALAGFQYFRLRSGTHDVYYIDRWLELRKLIVCMKHECPDRDFIWELGNITKSIYEFVTGQK